MFKCYGWTNGQYFVHHRMTTCIPQKASSWQVFFPQTPSQPPLKILHRDNILTFCCTDQIVEVQIIPNWKLHQNKCCTTHSLLNVVNCTKQTSVLHKLTVYCTDYCMTQTPVLHRLLWFTDLCTTQYFAQGPLWRPSYKAAQAEKPCKLWWKAFQVDLWLKGILRLSVKR